MPEGFFYDILVKTAVAIGATTAVAAITLLFKSVRTFVFYTRVEYDLPAKRSVGEKPFARSWSINWENNRLDFEAGDISNTHVSEVVFKNAVGKKHHEKSMHPSDSFTEILDGALGVKINSIVRENTAVQGFAVYTLRFVIRRKRWK